MTQSPFYDPRTVVVRQDLADAIDRAWRHLASPGTWWTGAQRLAMVREVRHAPTCDLCRQRKAALSPYGIDGVHDSVSGLGEHVVDVIHRVRTDAGRLTEAWLQRVFSDGMADGEYVEIVGVVATVTALDTLCRALGQPTRTLPEPIAGKPSRHRPRNARRQIAWVATVRPDELTPEDGDPYRYGGVHIQQALSLVPDTVAGFFDLDSILYLDQDLIRDFTSEPRAISHAQIELIAAKASYMNGCFY